MLRSYFKTLSLSAGIIAFSASTALSADIIPEPTAKDTKSTVVWFGGEIGESANVGFAGLVRALNGDLDTNGILFRISGAFADVEYTSAGTQFDLDAFSGDLSVGYQAVTEGFRASLFTGVDIQDNDVSPNDPNNSTTGTEVGFKVQGEFTANASRAFVNFIGNYSTANNSYYTRARLGLNIGKGIAIGPEGSLLGNDEFDGNKIGGFISGIPLGPLSLSANAGYSQVDGIGSREGAYGGAVASFRF